MKTTEIKGIKAADRLKKNTQELFIAILIIRNLMNVIEDV